MKTAPSSICDEFFDITVSLARTFGATPFDIMAQDVDEVIMLINHFLRKAESKDAAVAAAQKRNGKSKEKRIRVNDKTATGGWW